MECDISLQCFDTVGWATGRSFRLKKITECWFVWKKNYFKNPQTMMYSMHDSTDDDVKSTVHNLINNY